MEESGNHTPTRKSAPAGLLLILVAIAVLVPLATYAVRMLAPRDHTVEGNLTVSYMIETAPDTAAGSEIEASRIEFQPGYVVVITEEGAGRVFSVDRLRYFNWRQSAD